MKRIVAGNIIAEDIDDRIELIIHNLQDIQNNIDNCDFETQRAIMDTLNTVHIKVRNAAFTCK